MRTTLKTRTPFLYALRREVLRNERTEEDVPVVIDEFLYALRREVLRNSCRGRSASTPPRCFYTPFGVRCFGTSRSSPGWSTSDTFLYALRREVLRNAGRRPVQGRIHVFLYALRREVLRNMLSGICVSFARSRFYTPFGVRCFGTHCAACLPCSVRARFYTPFGVRCFGTVHAYVELAGGMYRVSIRPSA